MTVDVKIPLVCIVGPTASGKTALSIEVAKFFSGEIVSADSMQIYKGMDIATAKPTFEDMQGIPHHMLSFLELSDTYSVAQYCEKAHDVIKDIYSRGKLPILVGGTGLYVDSVINNTTFVDVDGDSVLREQLYNLYNENGIEYLLEMLSEFDPDMAQKLSEQRNLKRIVRAIEVYKCTGITMTEHNMNSHNIDSPYSVVKIGLTAADRQYLYDRINRRVDIMIENGILDEAKKFSVYDQSCTSSMAIGHKELLPYINGEADLDFCVENLKMQTRRYAKRQLTWFKRDQNIKWFEIDTINNDELKSKVIDLIKKVLFDEQTFQKC